VAQLTPSDGRGGGGGRDDLTLRAEAGHLTPEQLDDLAAQASADLDPDQEEVRSADRAALEDHLAGCAACRSALGDQVEVSAWLRRAPDPGPMPADVVARLDAALAGAASTRSPSGTTARSAGSAVDVASAGNVLPMAGRAERTGVLGRLAESRVTKSLVAAAAVVLIGAGGYAALHRNSANTQTAAGASSASAGDKAAAVPGAAQAAVPVRHTGTKYTTANITDEVAKQLSTAFASAGGGSASQPATGTGATTLASPAGLRACLSALNAPSAVPLLVDVATYNGKPAVVLVLPTATNGRELWVVSPTCAPDKDGTMLFKSLG
jgi:predicted anti-sigma-YlaC factor YlaD